MQYVFLEENSGVSQKGNNYNLIKLADPATYENHVISYDPNFLQPVSLQSITRGSKVEVTGDLRTPYQNTQFVATKLKVIQ